MQALAGLQDSDTVQVHFGSVSADIPVSILKNNMTSGNSVKLTVQTPPISALSEAESQQSPIETFDINLENMSTGELIHQLGGTVSITVNLTDDMVQQIQQAGKVKFYYFNPSTNNVEDMNATFNLNAKTVTFTTTHFSTYLIAKAKTSTAAGAQHGSSALIVFAGLAALVFCIGCISFVVIRKKMFLFKGAKK